MSRPKGVCENNMTLKNKLLVSTLGATMILTGVTSVGVGNGQGDLPLGVGLETKKASASTSATTNKKQKIKKDSMLDYVNNRRAEHNATVAKKNGNKSYSQKLRHNQDLTDFANWKARDMARNRYYDHTSLDGKTVQQQFDSHFGKNYHLYYIGENILMSNRKVPKEIFKEYAFNKWHNSKGHDKNMINAKFTEFGFGYYFDETTGYTYAVQHFGRIDKNVNNDALSGKRNPSSVMKKSYKSKEIGTNHGEFPSTYGSDGKYYSYKNGDLETGTKKSYKPYKFTKTKPKATAKKTSTKPKTKPKATPKKTTKKAKIYVVKRGDTLGKIAKEHNTTVNKIAKDNKIKNVNIIKVGQKLTIN